MSKKKIKYKLSTKKQQLQKLPLKLNKDATAKLEKEKTIVN